ADCFSIFPDKKVFPQFQQCPFGRRQSESDANDSSRPGISQRLPEVLCAFRLNSTDLAQLLGELTNPNQFSLTGRVLCFIGDENKLVSTELCLASQVVLKNRIGFVVQ